GWSTLFRHRSLMLLTLSYAAIGYVEYLIYFWINYYFKDVRKLGEIESRGYSTLVTLAMAAGMFFGGALSDRLIRTFGYRAGRVGVPVAGMLACALFLSLGILGSETAWIVTCFALGAAGVGATEGPMWATAIDFGGRKGATSAGIFNTGGNVGGNLAPLA